MHRWWTGWLSRPGGCFCSWFFTLILIWPLWSLWSLWSLWCDHYLDLMCVFAHGSPSHELEVSHLSNLGSGSRSWCHSLTNMLKIMIIMMVMMIFTLYLLYTPSSLHRGLQSWCLQPNYRIDITFPNLTFPLGFFTLKITAPLMLINCQEIPWYQKEIECLRCSRPSCPSPLGLKRSNVEIQKILDNWKEWYCDQAQSPK